MLSTPQGWVATAVVLVLAAFGQYILLTESRVDGVYITSLLMAGSVAFVNQHPRSAVAMAVFGATVNVADEEYPLLVGGVIGLLLVCGAAAYQLSGPYSFAIGAPFVVNAVSPFNGSEPGATSFLSLVLVTAALGFGHLVHSRHQVVVERDASVLAHSAALRDQMLLEERTRIARELHDVVAHHISSIAIQAETARHTTPGLPALGADRFAAIGDSARTALDEMRRLLGVMRTQTHAREEAPQPGLDQLNTLIDEVRALGTEIRFTVRGPVGPLPDAVELVAYRVVQETLTNARRHAPGAAVDASLDYTPTLLRVSVRDHGPGAADLDGGFGLVGMRERVGVIGGTVSTRNHPDGGLEVVADLPVAAGP
jgi:signal transduction histidine kinase